MEKTKTKNSKSVKTRKDENKKEDAKTGDKKVISHPLVKGPRITEKSAIGAERGIYTFNVERNATKNEIKKAIKLMYNVTPERVAIVQIKEKKVVRRGVSGKKQGGKKAVVYLKKGDKIAFV